MTDQNSGLTLRNLPHKKILILAINYFPEVTGCAPYSTDLAAGLVARGHSVTVVSAFPHYPAWQVQEEYREKQSFIEYINGVGVVRVRSYIPPKMNALTRGLFEFDFMVKAYSAARKLKFDSILSVSPSVSAIVVGARLAKKRGVPFKILVQDLMAAASVQSGIKGGKLVSRIVGALEGSSLRAADSVGVITTAFLQRTLDFGVPESRIVVTPNYSQGHVTPVDGTAARARYGWSAEDLVVMHTGNMGLKQDLETLVADFRELEKVAPAVRLKLVGDGSQREELERLAAGLSNVEFLGLVPSEEYSGLLAAADVLIVHESPGQIDMSVPSKITSYVAARKPMVVCSPDGGATQLATSSYPGTRWVNAENRTALRTMLAELSADKSVLNSDELVAWVDEGDARNRELRMQWVLS